MQLEPCHTMTGIADSVLQGSNCQLEPCHTVKHIFGSDKVLTDEVWTSEYIEVTQHNLTV